MKSLIGTALVVLLCACGGDDGGIYPYDAPPQPRDAFELCRISKYEGDPTQACIAEWGCVSLGAFTLACGTSSSTGPVCVCLHDEETPTNVMMVPSSCVDPAVLAAFARTNCGWSWL